MLKHPKKGSASHGALKSISIILLFVGAAIGLFLFLNRGSTTEVANNNKSASSANNIRGPEVEEEEKPTTSGNPIPKSLALKVPFTPQAPTANWDELHNEACEEASVIMTYAYFNNITSLPPITVEKEITKLTEYQKENFGYYLSITTSETAKMAEEVYDLDTQIVAMSEKNIKQALADGKLVIFPAQGQLLDNPNFTPPGPPYHMLVITGFDGSTFITNDPGTRNGRDYKYSYSTLEAAAGTWSHTAHEVDTSNKRIIIVSK